MKLGGWGNYPVIEAPLVRARYADELAEFLGRSEHRIARGNGRSYGDAAVCPELTIDMRGMDRLLAFDQRAGLLRCEAGLLLQDLLDLIVPRGWFVPVVPGTSLVTIGGMAAADVHGKNHHLDGGFSRHVVSLDLLCGDGEMRQCSPSKHPELFAATLGGMGLTGIILSVTVRLRPLPSVWIEQQVRVAHGLDEAMAHFEATFDWPYSVAWIDGLARGHRLGRSLLLLGKHLQPDALPARLASRALAWSGLRMRDLPLHAPGFALNRHLVRAFNAAYFQRGARRTRPQLVGMREYFFPLDAIGQWNRLYGRRGLLQFQSVLPLAASRAGLTAMLKLTSERGAGSMLAVLKRMGESAGPLSFPMPGYTLAMDFPNTADNQRLLRELEAVSSDHGGRIYLAKDACAGPDSLRQGYPRLGEFQALRSKYQAASFRSALSDRLELT